MSSSEEEVNFFSPKFNPIKALNKRDVVLPCPSAPIMDNISRFEMDSEGVVTIKEKKEKKQIPEPQPTTSKVVEEEPEKEMKIGRFLPSQGLVSSQRKPRRNIFTRMEEITGPLGQLKRWMDERNRVKVLTRRGHEVRGYCEGYVQAFDKHWNMVLTDVREVWTRKKFNNSKQSALGRPISLEECNHRRRLIGVKIPKQIKLNSTTGTIRLERFLNQILVRGEHIVSVSTQKDSASVD